MKSVLLIIASVFLFATGAQALEVEVAPKTFNMKYDVMAVGQTGHGPVAIFVTGDAAKKLCGLLNLVIDHAKQILVITGDEVTDIAKDMIGKGLKYADIAFAVSKELSGKVFKTVKHAIKFGHCLVHNLPDHLSKAAQMAFDIVNQASTKAVVLVKGAACKVIKLAKGAVRKTKGVACHIAKHSPVPVFLCE